MPDQHCQDPGVLSNLHVENFQLQRIVRLWHLDLLDVRDGNVIAAMVRLLIIYFNVIILSD